MTRFAKTFLLSMIICASCRSEHQKDNITERPNITSNVFFRPDNFHSDTLYIKTQFMECGEWGGHIELSKIYLKETEFFISFQKFSANCDSMDRNNGKPIQTLVKTLSKKLDDTGKTLIRNYCHTLLDGKMSQSPPFMNAGYIFQIKNLNGTLDIIVYPGQSKILDEYLLLTKRLFE